MGKLRFACLTCLALVAGCGSQKTFVYDSYANAVASAKVRTSKKVWIKTVDCDHDLLIAELKSQGFTIDRSQADYAVGVSEDAFSVTFNVYDGKSDALIYSKVYFRFEEKQTHEQFRAFIRQNLEDFIKGAA